MHPINQYKLQIEQVIRDGDNNKAFELHVCLGQYLKHYHINEQTKR